MCDGPRLYPTAPDQIVNNVTSGDIDLIVCKTSMFFTFDTLSYAEYATGTPI